MDIFLNGLPVTLLIGTILGCLSAAGLGGGSLLLLWLTVILKMDPREARVISLLFFLPAAAVTFLRTLTHRKHLRPSVLLSAASGALAAAAAGVLASAVETDMLRKLFAVYLILCGIRELAYLPRKAR